MTYRLLGFLVFDLPPSCPIGSRTASPLRLLELFSKGLRPLVPEVLFFQGPCNELQRIFPLFLFVGSPRKTYSDVTLPSFLSRPPFATLPVFSSDAVLGASLLPPRPFAPYGALPPFSSSVLFTTASFGPFLISAACVSRMTPVADEPAPRPLS